MPDSENDQNAVALVGWVVAGLVVLAAAAAAVVAVVTIEVANLLCSGGGCGS